VSAVTHRVVIVPPGEPAQAVLCSLGGDGPECLRVVGLHQEIEPDGTEIYVEDKVGRHFVPRVMWFRARGKWHRQMLRRRRPPRDCAPTWLSEQDADMRANPLRVPSDTPTHIAEAIAADVGCSASQLIYDEEL